MLGQYQLGGIVLSRLSTVLLVVAVEGVGCCGQAIMTPVAHQAYPVVHGSQVIDHGALVLALLSAPMAVGYATEVAKGIWVVYPHQSHDLGRF